MNRASRSWWARPCGARDVLSIAFPMVVSTLSFVVMQFCDRLFLTWYSNHDLAAVVPSGVLCWTFVSLPLGVAMYITTFVAQYDGAKIPHRIGEIVWQGIWIGLILFPVFVVTGSYSIHFFEWIGHSQELVWREAKYFNALCWGGTATVVGAAVEAFFIGRGKTVVVMVVSLTAASVNVLLDYLMIFGFEFDGHIVVAESGISGAGWATSISTWLKMAILFVLFLSFQNRTRFETWRGCRFSAAAMGRLLKFGLPNGFQFMIEGGAITVFILIIARTSDIASAATALAFSINMIVFVPVLGLSIAVTTIVGQQIGEQNPELAERATWSALAVGLPYTMLFGLAYLLVPGWFLVAHNLRPEEFAPVQELAIFLLKFVAVYCLFDTIQIVFVSCIKGAGDTQFVVWTTVVSSLLFLGTGFAGTQRFLDEQWQIYWWWSCLTCWIFLLSSVYFWRFRQGKWRTMTVIESEIVNNDPADPLRELRV